MLLEEVDPEMLHRVQDRFECLQVRYSEILFRSYRLFSLFLSVFLQSMMVSFLEPILAVEYLMDKGDPASIRIDAFNAFVFCAFFIGMVIANLSLSDYNPDAKYKCHLIVVNVVQILSLGVFTLFTRKIFLTSNTYALVYICMSMMIFSLATTLIVRPLSVGLARELHNLDFLNFKMTLAMGKDIAGVFRVFGLIAGPIVSGALFTYVSMDMVYIGFSGLTMLNLILVIF